MLEGMENVKVQGMRCWCVREGEESKERHGM